MREWSREIRVTIAVLVLAVAAVIALWPRDNSLGPAGDKSVAQQPWAASPRSSVLESNAVLEPLRQQAALEPCPQPDGAAARTAGPLAGVVVPCLADSQPVELGAALAGRPVLLNLWASWCGPCREEMPALAEYASRPGALPVIGVNVQDRASDGLKLLADTGAHYPSVVDVNGQLQAVLRVPPVLPLTYLLRPDGSVQRITEPATFDSADQVAGAVDRRYWSQPARP
jgi:thiol-disulfide isomerase/thioredoxin